MRAASAAASERPGAAWRLPRPAPPAGMFSSGTTSGSSILTISARWCSNQGGNSRFSPELLPRLVAREAAFGGGRALRQDAARRTAVDRVEVVAILDLGTVGVAELLVRPFCSASFSSLSTSSAMWWPVPAPKPQLP